MVDYTGLQGRISSIDENKESNNDKSQENSVSISNEDEAMEYALDYAKRNGKLDGMGNVGAMCEDVQDNKYTIRIYEDMEDHRWFPKEVPKPYKN